MMMRGPLYLTFGFLCALHAIACGAEVTEGHRDAGHDAAGEDAPIDSGLLACGDALCDPSQICLSQGPSCYTMHAQDGGCLDGYEHSDGGRNCIETPPP